MSAEAGRLPDFVLIGAMKSGTTTLYEYLARHDRVFMAQPKEPQFFSRDHVYARGLDWYRGLFAAAGAEQLCGEASTCYSRWPHFGDVPARLRQHVPDVRLVYLMRHPVERAYSHYRHEMIARQVRGTGPVVGFEQALDEIPEIFDASLYMRQIERYLLNFPRERLFCATLEDLEADPQRVLAPLQDFLGAPRRDLGGKLPLRSNALAFRVSKAPIRRGLGRARRLPLLSQLVDALPAETRRRARNRLVRSVASLGLMRHRVRAFDRAVSRLTPEARRRLLERLEKPTADLEDFLGRPLPAWHR